MGEIYIKSDVEKARELEEERKRIGLNVFDFYKLENPSFDLEKEKEEYRFKLIEAYRNLIEILKQYCDWKENYYSIVACWIIGTYLHKMFITYPYLYFNASKESGKSRSVRLVTHLCDKGEMVNSMTEAVLFRTKGTIGIDEFEKASRKGNENLLELLNSAYKKGVKVKRMKKVKTITGEEQQVEEFEVFRPIILANIWGMDSVLEDRTLPVYLEKTTHDYIANLLEIWEFDLKVQQTKEIIRTSCSLCSDVSLQNIYVDWNEYLIINNNIPSTNNYTKLHLFKKIKKSQLKGRMLELSFPLILVADMVEEEVVDEVIDSLKQISLEKNQEAFLENKDIMIIDMISQMLESNEWISMKKLVEEFRQFTKVDEEWINEKWMGRAIKRLMISTEKKRSNLGVEVRLDYKKAQEKIRMFK